MVMILLMGIRLRVVSLFLQVYVREFTRSQALSGEAARRGKQGLSRLSRLAVSVKYSEENSVLIRIYSLKWVG